MDMLFQPAYAPFLIACFVLVILLCIELIGFMFGGTSGFLDTLLPDSLVDADFDMDADMGHQVGIGLRVLDWFYVGKLPTMILLILAIAIFAISGIVIQNLAVSLLGYHLPTWLASVDALVVTVPMLKLLGALLYPIFPRDETSAVSSQSFIGRQVKIVLGTAKKGLPTQAKLVDQFGQTHYILVEPEPTQLIDNEISESDTLVVTKKIGQIYLVRKL